MLFSKQTASDTKGIVAALNASQAAIEFTPKGDILTANSNFLKATGYSLAEIVGRHHSLFCDPTYAAGEDYRRFWRDLADGQFQSSTFKRFGKGGRIEAISRAQVVSALDLISGSMDSVLENVASVASAMEQQNAVTSEISGNMQSAVTAINQINGSLDQINHTFANVTQASEKVKSDVEALVA